MPNNSKVDNQKQINNRLFNRTFGFGDMKC